MKENEIGAMYDELAEGYVTRRDTLQEKLGGLIGNAVRHLVAQCVPSEGLALLDVGCGYGADMLLFRRMLTKDESDAPMRMFGIDLSEWMVTKARALGLDCRRGDFRIGDDLAAQWDLVWCNMVLMHVPLNEMPEAVAKLRSFMAPAGVLGIGVKTLTDSDGTTLGREVVNPAHGTILRDRRMTYFDGVGLSRLLQASGLSIVLRMSMPSEDASYDYSWIFCASGGNK